MIDNRMEAGVELFENVS